MVKTFAFLQDNDEFYFDSKAAQRVVDFIERFCKLSDPQGEPFKLLPWEKQIITDIFGWKRKDNQERRFTTVYIEVPRKNGKTYFVGAILLYLLMAETSNAEVYASACSREQSGILFKSVLRMINQSRFLSDRLSIVPYKSEVKYAKGDSILKALSGESVGSHGKYPSAVVCDELHEWTTPKSEALFEALTSGFGNRTSPLTIMITTAGYGSQPTLAKRMHDKAMQFEQGQLDDTNFYGVIYGANQEDDWKLEDTWRQCNPSWHLAEKNLRREFISAKSEPSRENTFKRLYLNIWTQQQTRWIDLSLYDNATNELKPTLYEGNDLILGLDLSQIYDLTACTLLYPQDDKWVCFVRSYMPAQQIQRRSKEDNIPYEQWANEGFLIPTYGVSKGLTIDYEHIVNDILSIAQKNNIISLGYDPSNAVTVIPQLEDKGVSCLPIYQGFSEMSPASREFERRLTSGEIIVHRNPCLRWQAGNVEIIQDSGGRIRPIKPSGGKGTYAGTAKYKIDGIVSLIIAIQTALLKIGSKSKNSKSERKAAVYFV